MPENRSAGRSTPLGAVRTWWRALAEHDLPALSEVLAQEHVSTAGPAGRTVGRAAALVEAAAFLAGGRVDTWSIDDVVEMRLGDAAVCAYRWQESGEHAGRRFGMRGWATDVLRSTAAGWVIVAHHASAEPGAA